VEPAAEVGGRRPSLTGRAALLALVLVVLGVSYAYPLRTWIEQRADLAALAAERAELEQRTVDLEAQQQRWEDPAYVRAQARERLHFVLPGETVYIVVRPSGGTGAGGAAPDVPVAAQDGSWYGRLWGTVRAADGAGTP
jgi:cell division protein FtsB